MTLSLNREFLLRHLFVAAVMAAMGGWFGYDGFVNYPRQGDEFFEERHLKRENAISRQKEFMVLAFLASAAILIHLGKVAAFRFEFDDEGFTFRGVRRKFEDVAKVDRRLWEKKGIIVVDGIKLDAWHHVGVKDFVAKLGERGK